MIRTATPTQNHEDVGLETPSSPLLRYARWQARDFVTQRATILMLIAVLMMYPLVAGFMNVSPALERFANEVREAWIYIIIGVLTALGTLIGVRGIVSDDRQHGYHRFLFSKPIDAARYYAQALAVQGVGLLSVVGIVALLYAVTIAPVSLLAVGVSAAVFFVLFGGITFLFSTLTRLDWVYTLGTVAASLWTGYLVHVRGHFWLKPLSWLLPPLQEFGEMINQFVRAVVGMPGGGFSAALGHAVWPLAYGVIAFGAGLWVLRKRSMTR